MMCSCLQSSANCAQPTSQVFSVPAPVLTQSLPPLRFCWIQVCVQGSRPAAVQWDFSLLMSIEQWGKRAWR